MEAEVLETAVNASAMASGDLAQQLTCLMCSQLYKDPVMVECGHSFCRRCTDKAWAGQDCFTCPVCKEGTLEKKFTTNHTLANLLKTFSGAATASLLPQQREMVRPTAVCPDHDEKLKLYCENDGGLLCIICLHSPKHAGHKFLPIQDAARKFQAELPAVVSSLEETLKKANDMVIQQSEKIMCENSISTSKHHIMSEFKELNNFLKEQKENLLRQLREQDLRILEEMTSSVVKMEESRDHLRETITVAKHKIHGTDSGSLLTDLELLIQNKLEQCKVVLSSRDDVTEPELCRGTFKGPIQYFAWRQMKSLIGPGSIEQPVTVMTEQEDQPMDCLTDPPFCMDTERIQHPVKTEAEEMPVDCPVARPVLRECFQYAVKTEKEEMPLDCPLAPRMLWEGVQQPVKREEEVLAECSVAPPIVRECVHQFVKREEEERPMACPVAPPIVTESKMIWIFGDGYVHLAFRHAKRASYGRNLGFELQNWTVYWLPATARWTPHMRWCKMLHKVKQSVLTYGSPNVLLVHLGSNDLGHFPYDTLLEHVKTVLNLLDKLLPNTEILLSTVLPRRDWHGGHLEECRKNFNAMLSEYAGQHRFQMVRHDMLEKVLVGRFEDGSNHVFSNWECDMFVADIRNALLKKLLKVYKTATDTCPQQQESVMFGDQSTGNAQYQGSLMEPRPSLAWQEMESNATRQYIWILGNPYVCLAQQHALKSRYGQNLGFEEHNWAVHWLGKAKQWSNIYRKIRKLIREIGIPAAIFLHIGGHDLENRSFHKFVSLVKTYLVELVRQYPMIKFVFSLMLPEVEWMGDAFEQRRQMFNSIMGAFAQKLGYEVVTHSELEKKIQDHYTNEKRFTILSSSERDLFLESIRDSLLKVMLQGEKPATEMCQEWHRPGNRLGQNSLKGPVHRETEYFTECDQPQASLWNAAAPQPPRWRSADFSLDDPVLNEWGRKKCP